jgi:hypothetical protein
MRATYGAKCDRGADADGLAQGRQTPRGTVKGRGASALLIPAKLPTDSNRSELREPRWPPTDLKSIDGLTPELSRVR